MNVYLLNFEGRRQPPPQVCTAGDPLPSVPRAGRSARSANRGSEFPAGSEGADSEARVPEHAVEGAGEGLPDLMGEGGRLAPPPRLPPPRPERNRANQSDDEEEGEDRSAAHGVIHPTPYTLHPTPHTLHPTPYTLHPTPYTLHPTPHTSDPTPYTLHHKPSTRNFESWTLNPKPLVLNPEPWTLNPEP